VRKEDLVKKLKELNIPVINGKVHKQHVLATLQDVEDIQEVLQEITASKKAKGKEEKKEKKEEKKEKKEEKKAPESKKVNATVVWYNIIKGYGVLADKGGKRYFVFKDALKGVDKLKEGQEVCICKHEAADKNNPLFKNLDFIVIEAMLPPEKEIKEEKKKPVKASETKEMVPLSKVKEYLKTFFSKLARSKNGDIRVYQYNLNSIYSDYPDLNPDEVKRLAMDTGLTLSESRESIKDNWDQSKTYLILED